MAISLIDNLNSGYFAASNALTSQNKVVVYVEDVSDKPFWFDILQPYQTELGIVFEIHCYSQNSLATGSENLKRMMPNVGPYLLICMDSDYNYLLQNLIASPYIFQTYSYAVENLRCYAESLHAICVQATYNETVLLDFPQVLKNYSQLIYELLLWSIYFYQQDKHDIFSISDFATTVSLAAPIRIENTAQQTLAPVAQKINHKLNQLKLSHPDITATQIENLANTLRSLGLQEDNAYLFMYGHTLEDNVVGLLLKATCQQLKNKHFDTIAQQTNTETTQKTNQKQRYQKLVESLDDTVMRFLRANTQFKSCWLFNKIQLDIEAYIACFKAERLLLSSI